MLFAQIDNEIILIKNGPLGDIKGLVSFLCPVRNLNAFKEKLFCIGYCDNFYILNFENENCENHSGLVSINPLVWKNKKFSIYNFYAQDEEVFEEQSPHKREFRIACGDGSIKSVKGYRGDGSEYGRRSLPVEDARCMVNLSLAGGNKKMLDPFAGAGGIIYQFRYIAPGGTMTSIDTDPVLKPGLEFYGANHFVMNAAAADFPPDSFDSVITEVPFSPNAVDDIAGAFVKINGSLSKDGVFIVMCNVSQTAAIADVMQKLENYLLFSHVIDRKGTDVEICVWWKNRELLAGMGDFIAELRKIY